MVGVFEGVSVVFGRFEPPVMSLPDGAQVCDRPDHPCLIAYGNAVERSGAGALKRRANAAFAEDRAAFNRFMEAPAQTPRGIYLKFKAGIDENVWEESADLQYYDNIMLRAIRADLERLAKLA